MSLSAKRKATIAVAFLWIVCCVIPVIIIDLIGGGL